MLSSLVITFLPRSKCLLISWLQSPSAVILEPPKIKSDTVSPSISHEVMGPGAIILVFWMLSFKPAFSLSSVDFSYSFKSLLPLLDLGQIERHKLCYHISLFLQSLALIWALSTCLWSEGMSKWLNKSITNKQKRMTPHPSLSVWEAK